MSRLVAGWLRVKGMFCTAMLEVWPNLRVRKPPLRSQSARAQAMKGGGEAAVAKDGRRRRSPAASLDHHVGPCWDDDVARRGLGGLRRRCQPASHLRGRARGRGARLATFLVVDAHGGGLQRAAEGGGNGEGGRWLASLRIMMLDGSTQMSCLARKAVYTESLRKKSEGRNTRSYTSSDGT